MEGFTDRRFFHGYRAHLYRFSGKMTSRLSSAIKRVFDAAMATAGFPVLFPLLGILALAIRIDSPGSTFYRGVRVGRFGKSFRIFKFRTMVQNAEKIGASSTPEDDPRVTRVGRFLRKYKLDELPQLLNVIRGEMSLVGPRPQVLWAVELYTPAEKAVLSVRPGITDCASLRFRDEGEILRGSANPDQEYFEKIHPEKMRLSLEYIQKQCLWLDCQILVKTLAAVLFRPVRDSSDSKTDNKRAGGTISQ
jgi:lipopolysaccharide/colanic/teichoic acid biosynthesis glycosyltransferase